MANETYKCNARLKAATNGLTLEWDEYAKSERAYDNKIWIGVKQKVFLKSQGQEAVDEMLMIEANSDVMAKELASMPSALKQEGYD